MMLPYKLPSAMDVVQWLPQCQGNGSFWLPPQGSTIAGKVDELFYLILAISTFFFFLIVILMSIFVIVYRRRPQAVPGQSASHNSLLEIIWTGIPVAIVAIIFYRGFTAYMELRASPNDAREVRVTAQKWQWLFQYPSGYIDANLHVPVDEPVQLVMTSNDVIHSLFIPAFRVKMDVVPGRYARTWFHATEPGEYPLYCSEYCGKDHSDMLARVVVHKRGDYEKWLAEAADMSGKMSPVDYGELLYRQRGCAGCHSLDGTAGTGPSFKGIYGRPVELEGHAPVEVEDNYIRESILEPDAKIVKGYRPVMPTFKGILSDKDITALIEFIKSKK
jgi:cytochrome c oxidase subunit 2